MTTEELDDFIEQLRSKGYVIEPKVSKPSWLATKLKEQGTQRGLLLLVPLILEQVFNLDSVTSVQIVEGMIAIYGTHNILTEG
jgi:hypothetical protein